MMMPTADSCPRDSFLMARVVGSWNSSISAPPGSGPSSGRTVAQTRTHAGAARHRGTSDSRARSTCATARARSRTVLAEDAHRSRGRDVLRGQDRHHGGLARAVASEKARDGVLLDPERYVVHRDRVAVALRQVRDLDHGGHRRVPSVRPAAEPIAARSRMRSVRSSAPRPRVRASARSGSTKRSAKAVRRSPRSWRAPRGDEHADPSLFVEDALVDEHADSFRRRGGVDAVERGQFVGRGSAALLGEGAVDDLVLHALGDLEEQSPAVVDHVISVCWLPT